MRCSIPDSSLEANASQYADSCCDGSDMISVKDPSDISIGVLSDIVSMLDVPVFKPDSCDMTSFVDVNSRTVESNFCSTKVTKRVQFLMGFLVASSRKVLSSFWAQQAISSPRGSMPLGRIVFFKSVL